MLQIHRLFHYNISQMQNSTCDKTT